VVLSTLLRTDSSPAILISALFAVEAIVIISSFFSTAKTDDYQQWREDQVTNTSHFT
jgi:hypothetical protein